MTDIFTYLNFIILIYVAIVLSLKKKQSTMTLPQFKRHKIELKKPKARDDAWLINESNQSNVGTF